jgi:two-component system chemotaxis response regulator CheB
MHEARVLVVDDSAAMRAMFSEILEQVRNVSVVGTAANAVEALQQIEALRPNVLTLDVEMPGKSGMELLEEIMETRPMPIVMLSSLTQAGTEISLKAYELGAVECFPKPMRATPEQFTKTVAKLGKIVLAAANSNVRNRKRPSEAQVAEVPFQGNGRIVALSASMGGVEALTTFLAGYPAKCPPTAVVLQTEPAVAEAFIKRLDGELRCSVRAATDGAPLTEGVVLIAADPERHVVLEPGQPPKLRLVPREPIEGARPSANLLFGTIARAGIPAVGAVLSGIGDDGAKGLKLMQDAGCRTLVQERDSAVVAEAPAAALAANAAAQELPIAALAQATLACCSVGQA